jgi:hypothetical protein
MLWSMTAPRPLRALGAVLLAGLLAMPSPALAWSNGRRGPDTYGTHDRVFDLAIDIAGRHARWVCRRAALRATDDPDVRAGIDHASGVWWHVYDRWGPSRYGNAPEAVAVWLRKARARLRDGNRCGASRALGIMSHMLADVAQPMHTDQTRLEERVHADYESAVDARCATRAACRFGARSDGRDPAKPYGRTVAVARRAHEDYATLVRRFARHGYDPVVHRITRRRLARAANALADLIVALR